MPRSKIPVDPHLVEVLAGVGCTNTEIATITGCSSATISRRFAKNLTKGRDDLKMRLRKKQLDLALAGDRTMLIWLGKQYLDQTEKQKIESDVNHHETTNLDTEAIRRQIAEDNARADAFRDPGNGNGQPVAICPNGESGPLALGATLENAGRLAGQSSNGNGKADHH
jgi:hypothetical protein